jgi:two-component system response regulator FixJ
VPAQRIACFPAARYVVFQTLAGIENRSAAVPALIHINAPVTPRRHSGRKRQHAGSARRVCHAGSPSLLTLDPMLKGRDNAVSSPLIMVVDDDPAVCGSLKFALEIEGFYVRTYADGAELLDDADLGDCACFIIDQKLPGMNGLELIAIMRRRQVDAPAILITSHPAIMLRERAARAGIPIVEKPLLGNTLLERVQAAITRPPAVR